MLDGVLGILDLTDSEKFLDQVGFLAKLAFADASGFSWPHPIWDYVGRVKRKPNPAGYLKKVLREDCPELYETFEAEFPGEAHCQWLLKKLADA